MKAYEFSTTIDSDGRVELPEHLRDLTGKSNVRIILLVEDSDELTDEITEFAAWEAASDEDWLSLEAKLIAEASLYG